MREPETVSAFAMSTATADTAQNQFVRDALGSQRRRLPALLRSFRADEWGAPSRCAAWSVHEVVRHLCDATLKTTELLRGELPDGTAQFDPRTTPLAWLTRSANERPSDTLLVFEDASVDLVNELDRHFRDGTQAQLPFLYGRVPWSVVALHVLWDAWVHERDILLPLGRPHDVPAVESRAAAAYALALASLAAPMLGGTQRDESNQTVLLAGDGGGTFRLDAHDETITVAADDREGYGSDADPLRGALADVVDSLVGRGPELADVLRGPPAAVERLGTLRAFMLLPNT